LSRPFFRQNKLSLESACTIFLDIPSPVSGSSSKKFCDAFNEYKYVLRANI
jgi:hypothetical protein